MKVDIYLNLIIRLFRLFLLIVDIEGVSSSLLVVGGEGVDSDILLVVDGEGGDGVDMFLVVNGEGGVVKLLVVEGLLSVGVVSARPGIVVALRRINVVCESDSNGFLLVGVGTGLISPVLLAQSHLHLGLPLLFLQGGIGIGGLLVTVLVSDRLGMLSLMCRNCRPLLVSPLTFISMVV